MTTSSYRCRAIVYGHLRQLIATGWRCTRRATNEGYCAQHHKKMARRRAQRGMDMRATPNT